MIKIFAILVTVSSICVFCHALFEDQNQYGWNMFDQLEKSVIDCFFVDNNTESVELICDNRTGNYLKDNRSKNWE